MCRKTVPFDAQSTVLSFSDVSTGFRCKACFKQKHLATGNQNLPLRVLGT